MSFLRFGSAAIAMTIALVACGGAADGDVGKDSAFDSTGNGAALASSVAARFEALRSSPTELEAFLKAMPKGADLHNHLSGAVYAESFIGWGRQDGLCINPQTFSLVPAAQCGTAPNVALPASDSDPLFPAIVHAWSMADFDPSGTESGHDHFFNTFGKFGLVSAYHAGDMIAEAQTRAAAEGELYLELMLSTSGSLAGKVADAVWGTGHGEPTVDDLPSLYDRLLASADWANVVPTGRNYLDQDETKSRAALGCDGPSPQPGCDVRVRYLYQTTRTSAPHQIFAQFVGAFETAMADKRVVGMNLVSPEDNPIALRDYDLQMAMLDFLHRKYEGRSPLHIALHAGELSPSVLPASDTHDLTFHIRHAVELGHAERIGHGVDLLSEEDSAGLRAELREKNVLVEMCLTSNADILGVSGAAHPLAAYLADGVPLTIASDDPGVARSNMTLEYLRAADDQHLGYVQLKTMSRSGLEHSFLPGESLWKAFGTQALAEDCAGDSPAAAAPSPACRALLARSERAAMQWELERRFDAFEHAQAALP
jgi:hypothetical protein